MIKDSFIEDEIAAYKKICNAEIKKDKPVYVNTEQFIAAIIGANSNGKCSASLINALKYNNLNLHKQQDLNFAKAIHEINKTIEMASNPGALLGRDNTKHGEIFEQLSVNKNNANRLIEGKTKSSTFKDVGRIAPVDFKTYGVNIQSKCCESTLNSLKACAEHNLKYSDFLFNGKYEIPKEQFTELINVKNGLQTGLSDKSRNAIVKQINDLETKTGKPIQQIIKSSNFTYKDAQLNNVPDTVERNTKELELVDKSKRKQIDENTKSEIAAVLENNKVTIVDGVIVTAEAALFEGCMQTLIAIYTKKKQLKDYTINDWKEIGIIFEKGAIKGGIRGAAVWGLSEYTKVCSAPLASSYVATAFAVASLYGSYSRGEMNADDVLDQSQVMCFNTALNYGGAMLGQICIPIPALGAVVGSIAANIFCNIVINKLNKNEQKLIEAARARHLQYKQRLDGELREYVEVVYARMMTLWDLSNVAFDYNINASLRLNASVKLAQAHGVDDSKILKTVKQIDDYFLN
ncbi:MAG: hypothetical protein K2Y14_00115 [Burkholderiales bacterium]|nr:hypothetical protein [Burkholderiales bacterium]